MSESPASQPSTSTATSITPISPPPLEQLTIPLDYKPEGVEDKHYDPVSKQLHIGQIIKSRGELLKRFSGPREASTPAVVEQSKITSAPPQATTITEPSPELNLDRLVTSAGLTFQQLQDQLSKTGDFAPEHYEKLGKIIPKEIMAGYAKSLRLSAQLRKTEMEQFVGGKEKLQGIIDWATKNLPKEEFEHFSTQISDDQGAWKTSLAGITALFNEANGIKGVTIQGLTTMNSAPSPLGFTSRAEINAAKGDPRFSERMASGRPNPKFDAAYKKSVEERLARTDYSSFPQV